MLSKRTICEVHQQIYDLVTVSVEDGNLKQSLQDLTREAFDMGVKLVNKLIDHKISMLSWDRVADRGKIKALRLERMRMEAGL